MALTRARCILVAILAATVARGVSACHQSVTSGIAPVPIRQNIPRARGTMTPRSPQYGFLVLYSGPRCPDRVLGDWGMAEPSTKHLLVGEERCGRIATVWHSFWSDTPRDVYLKLMDGEEFVAGIACRWALDGGTCRTAPEALRSN